MNLLNKKRDYILAPLYYWQAQKVKQQLISLPEAKGARVGTSHYHQAYPSLTLTILGDSAAAGVGVDSQQDAPLGRIVHHLSDSFGTIHWALHATSGHSSYDLLYRLYTLPACQMGAVVINIGVNDIINQNSNQQWQHNLSAIIALLKRKFCAKHILFLSLPPMHLAPSLPKPLNALIGRRAKELDALLYQCCQRHQVHYVADEFAKAKLNPKIMFATDGFHPNRLTYDVWSKTLANVIKQQWIAN